MAEAILGILIMILSVSGAVGIIRWLAIKLSVPSKSGGRVYAVLLSDEPDIQLQMLMSMLEWDSTLNGAKVYAVDGGLSAEMSEYCEALCGNSRVTFVPSGKAQQFKALF